MAMHLFFSPEQTFDTQLVFRSIHFRENALEQYVLSNIMDADGLATTEMTNT